MSIGNNSMTPVFGAGWSRGLGNVLRGELRSWFSTRRWWVQIIIWAASVNLIYFIVALTTSKSRASMDTTLMLFNIFMGLAGPIGVSILMQTVVVEEKRSGTAAWVLSKPVSRVAFIIAKLIANGTGIIVTMILAQGLIAYLISTSMLGFSLSLLGFLAALGVHFINILFYLTLTLMLESSKIPVRSSAYRSLSCSCRTSRCHSSPVWCVTSPGRSPFQPTERQIRPSP